MTRQELKSCPWCGNQPKIDKSIIGAEEVYTCCVTEYMSKEMWQTRTPLVIDRERLARTIYTHYQTRTYGFEATPWEKVQGHIDLKDYYKLADAIILNQSSFMRQGKRVSVEEIAILLQKQDFLDGDMLRGSLIDTISMEKAMKISKAIHDLLGREG